MTERKKGNKMIYGEPTVMLGGIKVPESKKTEIRQRIYSEILADYLQEKPIGHQTMQEKDAALDLLYKKILGA